MAGHGSPLSINQLMRFMLKAREQRKIEICVGQRILILVEHNDFGVLRKTLGCRQILVKCRHIGTCLCKKCAPDKLKIKKNLF